MYHSLGSEVLSEYPILHRFLNFPEVDAADVTRALLVDCDTFFFGDVELMFSKYSRADCYAREESHCKRSSLGYDPVFIDEDSISDLGKAELIKATPPFNAGVVLFNAKVWNKLEFPVVFLSYVWRFLIWMAMNPVTDLMGKYREGFGVQSLRDRFGDLVTDDARCSSLAYPSASRWILDEVALWFTLGHVQGLAYEDFDSRDVLKNGEFSKGDLPTCDSIVCHYFSNNVKYFDEWVNNSLDRKRMR
jgi:hypothetical protein